MATSPHSVEAAGAAFAELPTGKHAAIARKVRFSASPAEKLPDAWEKLIGENGCQLSGGGRQRISISRALLKDAPVILLDEATASLGAENETSVQAALSRLIARKTFLISAHRFSTLYLISCNKTVKTLPFLQGDRPALILAEGTARIDNQKYRARFGCKAKMIPPNQVEALVGHDVGGVCPFGVNDGVSVYLDESLKRHGTVYPAAGTNRSAVRLAIAELERACDYAGWVDVCKNPEEWLMKKIRITVMKTACYADLSHA